MKQIQQVFIIARDSAGRVQIEAGNNTNGARRKLDTTHGIARAIEAELNRLELAQHEAELSLAEKAATEALARHTRIVNHATRANPTTLQFIEPKKSRRTAIGDALVRAGYSRREAELSFERSRNSKFPTRPKLPLLSGSDV